MQYEILNFFYVCSLKGIKTLTIPEIRTFTGDSASLRPIVLRLCKLGHLDKIGEKHHFRYFITPEGIQKIKRYNDRHSVSDLIHVVYGGLD